MARRMKRNGDRVVVLLLIVCMGFGMNVGKLRVNAETLTSGDYRYEILEDGMVEITDYDGEDAELVIPDMIDNRKVTSIGDSVFNSCSGLTSLSIPGSVTNLGEYPFENCSELTSIHVAETNLNYSSEDGVLFDKNKGWLIRYPKAKKGKYIIPDSVTDIGDAFRGCSELTSVTISKSVANLGYAFEDCSRLMSICVVEENPTYSSEDGVLFNKDRSVLICCPGGKEGEYGIPENVTSIGADAFNGCSELAGVTISKSVTSIGGWAFYDCSGLESMTIPENVTSIGYNAFGYCSGLTSVTIAGSVTEIGDDAFNKCRSSLTLYVEENSDAEQYAKDNSIQYKYIGENDKDNTTTEVPKEPTTTQLWGDYDYKILEDGTVEIRGYEGKDDKIKIPDMIDSRKVASIGNNAFRECSSITSVIIPDTVTSIGKCAFWHCTSLESVIIPNTITSINQDTFFACSNLTSVVIPDSVTTIGLYAFADCSSLKNVNIPNSVTSIDYFAFKGCKSLKSVSIPDSVISIGVGVFGYCSNLISINVDVNNKHFYSENGVLFKKDKSELLQCPAGKMGEYVISNSVRKINDCAFYGCKGLMDVIIPHSVNSIGHWAFYSCSSLKSVNIPDSVTSIGSYAFGHCSDLTSANIPSSVTNIGWSAFDECSSLNNVIIPDSVTSISDQVFANCIALTNVTIPNSVTSIGKNAFFGCSSLENISIPSSVISIGEDAFWGTKWLDNKRAENPCVVADKILIEWPCEGAVIIPEGVRVIGDGAFYDREGMESLTSVLIPRSVTNIGKDAFRNCGGLKDICIPDSVTSIGEHAFMHCSNLENISIPSSVTRIGGNAFTGTKWLDNKRAENPCVVVNGILIEWFCEGVVNVPIGVTSIGERAFCGSFTSVILPDSVTSIGKGAFKYCGTLKNISIPSSVTSIGEEAFAKCSNSLTLEVEKDSYAEQYAKDNNIHYQYIEMRNTDNTTTEVPKEPTTEKPVTEQTIPNQPTEEEEQVVVGSVTMVPVETETDDKPVIDDKVKNQNGSGKIKTGTVLVSKTGIYKVTSVNKKTVIYMGTKNKKVSAVKVPEEIKINKKKYKVTSVSANAFKNNKKVKTVTIGQNVKGIGKNAFRGCKNLKKVTIGKNVTTIGNYAFYGCKKLNLIEIRSSKLKKVGKAAFKNIAKRPTARVPKGKIESYKKLFKGKM